MTPGNYPWTLMTWEMEVPSTASETDVLFEYVMQSTRADIEIDGVQYGEHLWENTTSRVLHIRFPPVKSDLTFDSQEGSSVQAGHYIWTGNTSVQPTASDIVPTKEGNSFCGWFNETDAESGTAVMVIDRTGDLVQNAEGYVKEGVWSYRDESSLTLYAAWKAAVSNLTFHATDGFAEKYGNITYGQSEVHDNTTGVLIPATELIPTTSKTGHRFGGWNISDILIFNETGYLVQTAPGYVESGKWKSTIEKISLEAYWLVNSSTLKFNTTTADTPGSLSDDGTIYYNTSAILGVTAAQIKSPSKAGYTLYGWNVTGTDVNIINAVGSLVSGTVIGYITDGKWIRTENGEVIEVSPWWGPKSTMITLDNRSANPGATDQVMTVFGEAMPAVTVPTKDGYTFHGYYNSTDSGSTFGTQFYTETGTSAHLWDIDADTYTLYANWTENTYTIYFDNNTGTGSMASVNVRYSQEYVLPASGFSAPIGKVFDGWLNGTSTYSVDKLLAVGSTVSKLNAVDGGSWTFYANWTLAEYTLTLKESPAGKGTTWTNVTDLTRLHYIDNVRINATNVTGYHFVDWRNGTGDVVSTTNLTTFVMPAGDVALTANFAANVYNVSFDKNNGVGIMGQQQFTYDKAQSLSAVNYTRSGYTFAGWNKTGASGTKVDYADKASVKNLADANNSVVTLYAVWTPIEYTITYADLGDKYVDNSANTITSYNITSPTITLNPAVRSGYDFEGWYNSSAKTTKVTSIPTGSIGNVDLYANWTIIDKHDTSAADGSLVPTEYIFARVSEEFMSEHYGLVTKLENLSGGSPVTFKALNSSVSTPTKAGYTTYVYGKFDLDATVNTSTNKSQITIQLDRLAAGHQIGSLHVLHYVGGSWKEMTILSRSGLTIVAETDSFCPMAVVAYNQNYTPTPTNRVSEPKKGTTVILQEGPVAPTQYPTTTPTQEPTLMPTVSPIKPTTHPTTSKSPAPFVGLISGLGAVALLLRMRK